MTEEKLGEVIISVDTPDKKKSKMPLLPLRVDPGTIFDIATLSK